MPGGFRTCRREHDPDNTYPKQLLDAHVVFDRNRVTREQLQDAFRRQHRRKGILLALELIADV